MLKRKFALCVVNFRHSVHNKLGHFFVVNKFFNCLFHASAKQLMQMC